MYVVTCYFGVESQSADADTVTLSLGCFSHSIVKKKGADSARTCIIINSSSHFRSQESNPRVNQQLYLHKLCNV